MIAAATRVASGSSRLLARVAGSDPFAATPQACASKSLTMTCSTGRSMATQISTRRAPMESFYDARAIVAPTPRRAMSTTRAVRNEASNTAPQQGQTLGKMDEPKLSLTFTCTVTDCGHRSTHQFSKRSYEKGIVLVQCPGCKNRHLIADHLGWFKQTPGEPRTVEDIVREHGGRVRRGIQHGSGSNEEDYETIEILSDTHAPESDASSNGKQ